MKTLNNLASQAVTKLQAEKGKVSGNKEKAMAGAVMEELKNFCIQNEEFARAVVIGGGFDACMKKVAEGVGSSISDLEAYKKAIQFYFPGAEVKMQLTINLGASDHESREDENDPWEDNHNYTDSDNVLPAEPAEPQQTMVLDLMDYFK